MIYAPPMPDFFNRSRNAKWIDWNARIQLNPDVAAEMGIVAAYPGWPVGGNTLYDVSGRGNHGTLTNGPTWTRGKFGEPAISFDGTNDYVSMPLISIPATGSIFVRWRFDETIATAIHPIFRAGRESSSQFIDLYPYLGTFYAGWVNGGGNDDRVTWAISGLTQGTWYDLALTWVNGGITTLFVNAQSVASGGTLDATWDTTTAAAFNLMADEAIFNASAGQLAGLSLFNRALTANQIAELYRNPFLLYWQPSRTSIFDMRYDPTPYERSFRSLTPNAFAFDSGEANAKAIDASYGQVTLNDTAISLDYTSEGRLIPSSPVGFQVQFRAKAANADYSFIQFARVYKNGSEVWSQGYTYGTANIGATDTDFTIGDATELFDTTWTATDEFKVRIEIYAGYIGADTLYVDGCELTTWYSDGSGQTITVTIASATASASAPTVTPAATVTMPTASSTAAAIVPTVTPGATSITIGTCSATAAASAPTLTPTVTIVSPTASATASASTPTITAGTSTITVTTASATGTASAPTITPTVDIASPTASATAAATAPSVTAGATTITVTTGTATAAAIDAGITNATLITPGDATATAAVSALLVIFGSTSIVVGTATGTAAVSSPTIAAGTTTISVGVVSATAGAVVVAVVSGNTAGTSTASVFYVLHGTDTHPIPLLGADPRPHEAAGTSNRFRELKG